MRLHIYQIQLWTLLGLFSSLPFPPPLFFVVGGGGGLHCKLPLHKTSHFGLMLYENLEIVLLSSYSESWGDKLKQEMDHFYYQGHCCQLLTGQLTCQAVSESQSSDFIAFHFFFFWKNLIQGSLSPSFTQLVGKFQGQILHINCRADDGSLIEATVRKY